MAVNSVFSRPAVMNSLPSPFDAVKMEPMELMELGPSEPAVLPSLSVQPYATFWKDSASADVHLSVVIDYVSDPSSIGEGTSASVAAAAPGGGSGGGGSGGSGGGGPAHAPLQLQSWEPWTEPLQMQRTMSCPLLDSEVVEAIEAAASSHGRFRHFFLHSIILGAHSNILRKKLVPSATHAQPWRTDSGGSGAGGRLRRNGSSGGGDCESDGVPRSSLTTLYESHPTSSGGESSMGGGGGGGGSNGGSGSRGLVAPGSPGGGRRGSAGGRRKSLTEHVASSDVAYALEAVLRFSYTHLLCEVGGSPEHVSVATLLNMVDLSDRFQAPACLDAALEELVHRGADGVDTSTAVRVFLDGLSLGAARSPHAAAFQAAVLYHLQQRVAAVQVEPLAGESAPVHCLRLLDECALLHRLGLDNAEAVGAAVCLAGDNVQPAAAGSGTAGAFGAAAAATAFGAAGAAAAWGGGDGGGGSWAALPRGRLDLLLPHLPFAALLHLLQGRLTARSENSVLMMVDAWVAAAAAAQTSPPLTSDQRVQLSSSLRLGSLSRGFLFETLPALPWMQLDPSHHLAVVRFATSPPSHQAALRMIHSSTLLSRLPGPAAWYDAPRTTWTPPPPRLPFSPMDFSWDVTEAQLQAALAVARITPPPPNTLAPCSRAFFFGGVTVHVGLLLTVDKGDCRIVSRVSLGAAGYPSALLDCQVRVSVNGAPTLVIDHLTPAECWRGFPLPLAPEGTNGLDPRSWVPCLVGGKISVRGSIDRCE